MNQKLRSRKPPSIQMLSMTPERDAKPSHSISSVNRRSAAPISSMSMTSAPSRRPELAIFSSRDRKNVGSGKRVSVRGDIRGRRDLKKKKHTQQYKQTKT